MFKMEKVVEENDLFDRKWSNFKIPINFKQARKFLYILCRERNHPRIFVRFSNEDKKLNWLARLLLRDLKSEKYSTHGCSDGKRIWLYKRGQNLNTLLHEVAHVTSGAIGHGLEFRRELNRLAKWANNKIYYDGELWFTDRTHEILPWEREKWVRK